MTDQDAVADAPFLDHDGETDALKRCLGLLNTVDDGIYQLDAAGRIVAANDALLETTGYTRDELLGEHASVVVHDADVGRLEREIRARLAAAVDPATTFSLAIETAEGEPVPCELRFSLLEVDGEFQGTVGVVRPIDESHRTRADERANVQDRTKDDNGSSVQDRASDRDRTKDDDRSSDQDRASDQLPSIWETYESISSVIDEADVGVFVLDSVFDVVWIDETIEEYFGLDRTAVVGRDKRTLIEESIGDRFADPATFTETVLATYDDNTYVEQFECRITAGDDREERWLEHRSTPIESGRYAGGRIELYYDITDRKESERARRESERQLQREYELTDRILETSPVGIAVVNPDGSVDRANERMAELLELSPETDSYTTVKREMYDVDGSFLPIEERPVARVFETGTPVTDREIMLESRDGRRRWLSINALAITDEHGTIERVVETATDVTDLKELAERRKRDLEEREKELAAVRLATKLLESRDRPVDALVEEFASALPQFFQSPADTAARVSVGETEATTDGFDRFDTKIAARTTTVTDTPIEIVIAHAGDAAHPEDNRMDGHPVEGDPEDNRMDGHPVEGHPADERMDFLDEEQQLIETLTTLLQFHFDRREYIDELQASNERLEQFAYAASHDLQEPLRMVSSYLQLIERRHGDELDPDAEEFLDYAVDGAERMREMIDGLLQYSRVETRGDPFEPVDLDDVLADVRGDLQLAIEEEGAEIAAESLPTVDADPSQLRQVFQNLLDNAIRYSGDETPRVHVTAEASGDEWVISVGDEGIGIDPADADRIFEVFQRLHTHDEHPGTGIGLALCRRIVERHGGEIWVDTESESGNESGTGTTVSFTLPAVEDRDDSSH